MWKTRAMMTALWAEDAVYGEAVPLRPPARHTILHAIYIITALLLAANSRSTFHLLYYLESFLK
jgi:hypothetical protein